MVQTLMSALGQKRTLCTFHFMSAFAGKADIRISMPNCVAQTSDDVGKPGRQVEKIAPYGTQRGVGHGVVRMTPAGSPRD